MLKLSRHWRDEALLRQYMACGVFLLCAYAAWIKVDIYFLLQWPLAFLSGLLCLSVFLFPEKRRREIGFKILRDPVFWFGTAFLLLLGIQWINSGYVGRSPSKWTPWAVRCIDVAEMLGWFFPAYVILLVARNILKRRNIKILVYLLIWNSAILASVGILQSLLGLEKILGIWRVSRTDFFATFEYPNHAAAWFYLHAALAAGMAYDAEIKRKPRIRVAVFGACFMCCIAASCLTLSRVGAFAALVQLAVVSVMLLFWIRKNLRSEAALNAYIGVAIVALIGVTLFLGAGRGSLAWEVGSKTLLGRQSIAADFSTRAGHVDCAWEMIKDYPVFGVGAQGCHALAHQYIPEEELRSWMVNGRANVHCDPIQFLAEFGVVGSLAMALVVAALVQNMVSARHSALFYWAAGGLALVFVHSLIDLPFRCPAILLIWSCLSAALPCLVSSEHGTGDGMKKAGILQDVAF